jgi:hypothetical protein
MMSAGLPGIGLSGLFMLLSALLMPAVELVRTVRGRSNAARWAVVGRHWAMAAAMVVLYVAVFKAISAVVTPSDSGRGLVRHLVPQSLGPAGVLIISVALVATLFAGLATSARVLVPAPGPALLGRRERYAGRRRRTR